MVPTEPRGEYKPPALTFHHGGRFGDLFAALYTVRAICTSEGRQADLVISDFHQGNWSLAMAWTVEGILRMQPYVRSVEFLPYKILRPEGFDYDLHAAEDVQNPQDFPEYDGSPWPGNVHLAKRYAHFFHIPFNPEEAWLEPVIPYSFGASFDVVFHAPLRRVTNQEQLRRTVALLRENGYSVAIVGGPTDNFEWLEALQPLGVTFLPPDFTQTYYAVSVARCFLGAVSSVQMLAEGLKKPRFVQVAPGCNNVHAQGQTGWTINDMTPEEIMQKMLDILR